MWHGCSISNKAENSLSSNNFYKETTDIIGEGETVVTRTYYKDGKCKSISEMYTEEGVEINFTKYATAGSDESIYISEGNKKITVENGEFTKMANKEENLKISFLKLSINNILHY